MLQFALAGVLGSTDKKNVYGDELVTCSTSGMAMTGFTRDGYCTECAAAAINSTLPSNAIGPTFPSNPPRNRSHTVLAVSTTMQARTTCASPCGPTARAIAGTSTSASRPGKARHRMIGARRRWRATRTLGRIARSRTGACASGRGRCTSRSRAARTSWTCTASLST
eukprot:scaffold118695_cov63-Phaeocystis_antarctica.AAC.2